MIKRSRITTSKVTYNFYGLSILKTKFTLEKRVYYKNCFGRTRYKWVGVYSKIMNRNDSYNLDEISLELNEIYEQIRRLNIK